MADTLSFEQLLNVRSAYGATFDASGRRLYFISTTTGVPNLWGLDLERSAARTTPAWPEPLAVGPERVQYAFASPISGRVLFGLDRGGDERTQLYLLDGIGTRARPLTDAPEVIHHFGDWHTDGRQICYASNARDTRYFDLYLMDVESGELRLVYRHDSTNRALGFEPGGGRLLAQRIHSLAEHELLLVDPEDGSAESLTAGSPPGRYESSQWAPGGRSIYCVSDREGDFLAPLVIGLEPRSARTLALHEADVEDLALSPDGGALVYAVNAGGHSTVRFWDLTNLEEMPLHIRSKSMVYDAGRWAPTFNWARRADQLTLSATTATEPLEVWIVERPGPAPRETQVWQRAGQPNRRQVTRSWTAGVPLNRLSKPELVRYPSFDGRQIPAFLFRPDNAPASAERPAILWVHGGPESQFRPSFNPVVQYLAYRGFVVLAPNVRGSTGYGKAYSHLDDVEKRLDSVRDLAAAAEWLAAGGEAHPKRIGVMGGSYGGYMVLAAITERPDLWAAAVDIVGIANFVTFLERTGPWRRHLREAEYGSLERDRPLLERLSPIHRADRIVAPLMVVHGANDPRVPVSEAEQIVATLRGLDRPVEYMRFEDEGHGLVKLENRLVAYPRIADFFERHLMRAPTSLS